MTETSCDPCMAPECPREGWCSALLHRQGVGVMFKDCLESFEIKS